MGDSLSHLDDLLLANRIFMFFPDKLSKIILLRYGLRDNIRARAERSWG